MVSLTNKPLPLAPEVQSCVFSARKIHVQPENQVSEASSSRMVVGDFLKGGGSSVSTSPDLVQKQM